MPTEAELLIRPGSLANGLGIERLRSHSGGSAVPFRRSRRSLRALRAQLHQGPQSREVVGGHRQGQKLVDLIQSLHHHLTDRADELAPAEALLDALPLALADLVAGVSGGATVDGAAPVAVEVLRHMRRDVQLPQRLEDR